MVQRHDGVLLVSPLVGKRERGEVLVAMPSRIVSAILSIVRQRDALVRENPRKVQRATVVLVGAKMLMHLPLSATGAKQKVIIANQREFSRIR